MNRVEWKEICRKTKWASKKKRLTKQELGDLMDNVVTLDKFMGQNKSTFGGTDRTDPIYKRIAGR